MGIGPPEIREGDKVVVILGCDRPLVLRQERDVFRVVGACYVYGMMNGEMIQRCQEEGGTFSQIVIG
jgi:hypothetical protein